MKNLSSFFIKLILLMIVAVIWYPIYSQWPKHIIDDSLDCAGGLYVADMDNDNDLDVVASDYNKDIVLWYEAPLWTKHIICGNLIGPDDLDVADINDDNTLDVVATSYDRGDIIWYEAPTWTEHLIEIYSNGAQHVKVTDLDGDNDLDVVATGRDAKDFRWYEAPSWTKHIIDSNLDGGRGFYVTDMNSDDTLDVVAAGQYADIVCWYEGPLWTKHIIDPNLDGAISVSVADIDNDDTLDVVAAAYDANQVVLYKAPSWSKNVIDADLLGARCVYIADIDDDNDLDVVSTGYISNLVVWYEAPSWKKHIIDSYLVGAGFVQLTDIDGDNDLDVIADGTGGDVVWYENILNTIHIQSIELYPRYLKPLGDTLIVNCQLGNPENHSVKVIAMISRSDQAYQDSIELFDDGLHNDGGTVDNNWGGSKFLSILNEDYYSIELRIHDLIDSTTNLSTIKGHFTTAGPVALDSIDISYSVFGYYKIKPYLHNMGKTATITSASVRVVCYDPCVTSISSPVLNLPDIAPGNTIKSSTSANVYVDSTFPGYFNFNFEVMSDGRVYWNDSSYVLVGVKDEIPLPVAFNLSQNYPNPFNPSTTIGYQLAESGKVTLNIYNILGRKVATLINEYKPIGKYEVEFNTTNLPSGVYFYQLKAGSFVDTKKMLLLK